MAQASREIAIAGLQSLRCVSLHETQDGLGNAAGRSGRPRRLRHRMRLHALFGCVVHAACGLSEYAKV
jgi:hypothetical protein